MENADQGKYGSLITGLQTQKSLGTDQYPTTLADAIEVLSNCPFDKGWSNNYKKKKRDENNNNNKQENNDEEQPVLTMAQIEGKCYCCGSPKHRSNKCPERTTRAREDWVINKAAAAANLHTVPTQENDNVSVATAPPTIHRQQETQQADSPQVQTNVPELWQLTMMFKQSTTTPYKQQMKNKVILDSGSLIDVFTSAEKVTNIRPSLTTLAIGTNGGTFHTNKVADVHNHGTVWFDEESLTNIFSLAKMCDRYHVTFDNKQEDAFHVHTGHGTVKFKRTLNNLYKLDPSTQTTFQLLETVEENRKFYTPRQFQRAKQARAIFQAIGTPSLEDFKKLIKVQGIDNCPVTIEDIQLAEDIFGKDIGALKGKTTRKKPAPVVRDIIDVPKELNLPHKNLEMAIDTIFVNGMPFLSTITRNLMYRTLQVLSAQND